MLGYVWAFVPPLVTCATFILLASQNVIRVGETGIPYPAFILVGTVLWQLFLESVNGPLKSVLGAKAMLTKINFPREALILASVAEVLFNFLIRLTLLVPVLLFYSIPIGPSVLLAPLGIAALLLLGLSIGLLITPVGLLYGDVGRAVTALGTFWMLLTPVVYPPPTEGAGAFLLWLNPVSSILSTTREWMTSQPVTAPVAFAMVTLLAAAALFLGWVLYRISMPILIERMGD